MRDTKRNRVLQAIAMDVVAFAVMFIWWGNLVAAILSTLILVAAVLWATYEGDLDVPLLNRFTVAVLGIPLWLYAKAYVMAKRDMTSWEYAKGNRPRHVQRSLAELEAVLPYLFGPTGSQDIPLCIQAEVESLYQPMLLSGAKSTLTTRRRTVFCTRCGQALRDGVKFCEKCGAKVREYAPESAASTGKEKLCGNCGCSVTGDSKICKWCGADLK
jgi:hypothetical protein